MKQGRIALRRCFPALYHLDRPCYDNYTQELVKTKPFAESGVDFGIVELLAAP